jgi:hypothetical protein
MISGFLSDFFRKADFSRHGSAVASCVECGSEGPTQLKQDGPTV